MSTGRRWLYGMIGSLIGVTACQRAETPEQMQARLEQESQAFREWLQTAQADFERQLAGGHVDSIAVWYMDNAVVMPPNAKAVAGQDNIRNFFMEMVGMGQWTLDLATTAATANGSVGVESGTYTLAFTPGPNAPQGMPPADSGKYLVHWQKMGDQWMIAHDIWNSDMAIPQPATPPGR